MVLQRRAGFLPPADVEATGRCGLRLPLRAAEVAVLLEPHRRRGCTSPASARCSTTSPRSTARGGDRGDGVAATAGPRPRAAAPAELGPRARRLPTRLGREQPRGVPAKHSGPLASLSRALASGGAGGERDHGDELEQLRGAAVRRAPLLPRRRALPRRCRRPHGELLGPRHDARAAADRGAGRSERAGQADAQFRDMTRHAHVPRRRPARGGDAGARADGRALSCCVPIRLPVTDRGRQVRKAIAPLPPRATLSRPLGSVMRRWCERSAIHAIWSASIARSRSP